MDKSERPYYHISSAVDSYFLSNNISYKDAAKKLGVTPGAVSYQLSGKTPFGHKAAESWAQVFPFNKVFLITGEGSLMLDADSQERYLTLYKKMAQACSTQGFFSDLAYKLIEHGKVQEVEEILPLVYLESRRNYNAYMLSNDFFMDKETRDTIGKNFSELKLRLMTEECKYIYEHTE